MESFLNFPGQKEQCVRSAWYPLIPAVITENFTAEKLLEILQHNEFLFFQ